MLLRPALLGLPHLHEWLVVLLIERGAGARRRPVTDQAGVVNCWLPLFIQHVGC